MATLSDNQVRGIALREIAPIALGMFGQHDEADLVATGAHNVGWLEAVQGVALLREVRSRLAGSASVKIIDSVIAALEAPNPREGTRAASEALMREFSVWVLDASVANSMRAVRGDSRALFQSVGLVADIALRAATL